MQVTPGKKYIFKNSTIIYSVIQQQFQLQDGALEGHHDYLVKSFSF